MITRLPFRTKIPLFNILDTVHGAIKVVSKCVSKSSIPFFSTLFGELKPLVCHYAKKSASLEVCLSGKDLFFIINFKSSRTEAIEYQRLFEASGFSCNNSVNNTSLLLDPNGFSKAYAFAEAYSFICLLLKYEIDATVSFNKTTKDGIFNIDTVLKVPYSRIK